MQQHTWTQTADTKHVKGEKAIYLLSHTELHARLSKHSSIGRPYREATGFCKLGIRTKRWEIKLLKYLLNYGVGVQSNNIPVNCLQRSMRCLFFLKSFVNGIININQSNMNDGVSALFDTIHSDKITWILAFPKQVDNIEMSKQISWLLEYGKISQVLQYCCCQNNFWNML